MKYLVELLEKETDVYNDYLDLAVKKKQALIDNDIDVLEGITEEEKDLSSKVLALEAARIEYLREQGYPGTIQLDELLPKLDKDDRDEVKEKASTLKDVLSQCKKFNDGNMSLLKQSSNYINHMIKIFTSNLSGSGEPATYKKGAQKLDIGKIADLQG